MTDIEKATVISFLMVTHTWAIDKIQFCQSL